MDVSGLASDCLYCGIGRSYTVSKRQIEANRANATKSTGPQTSTGKATSSRNAYRHGLCRWDEVDRAASHALEAVLMVQGPLSSLAVRDLAEASRRQARIRDVRRLLIMALIERYEQRQMRDLLALERYDKVAGARQRRGLKRLKL